MQYPGGKAGSYSIPGSVAFHGCNKLTEVYFKGNRPTVGWGAFIGANKATIFYVPGTKGWGTNFADRPTAIWKP
jgi:hypothetical protein